eukprot:jgi/Bigna1/139208/aug1.49_g13916
MEDAHIDRTLGPLLRPVTAASAQKSRFEIGRIIGRGAFGTVHLANWKERKMQVAIKVIDLEKRSIEAAWREVKIMGLFRHANIVAQIAAFTVDQNLWLVLPYYEMGSCKDLLQYEPMKAGIKSNHTVATILKFVLEGLSHLHRYGVAHKDIKAENILISVEGSIAIADFGIACESWEIRRNGTEHKATAKARASSAQDSSYTSLKFEGTPYHMAPEIITGSTQMTDIKHGRAPYEGEELIQVTKRIVHDPPPTAAYYRTTSKARSLFKFCKHYHQFVSTALNKNANERPSANAMLESRFIK